METSLAEPQVPAQNNKIHRFTKENAAQCARNAVKSRLKREQAERDALADAIAQAELGRPLLQRAVAQAAAYPTVNRVALVAEQIVRTRKMLNSELEPRERAQLLCALDKLLDRERILAGLPLPGSRRPGREKPERGQGASSSPAVDE
jgi:predicted transcriptional regulator